MTQKGVKEGLRARGVSLKPFERLKAPKTTQTSPLGQREDHGK
jgi:hypothetical protein